MKELVRNFLYFGFAVALEKIISFLLVPLYARVFTPEEFGAIDVIQSFIAVISIFCYLQLETSFQRFYYDYTGSERRTFNYTILVTMVGLSLIVAFVATLFSGEISMVLFSSIKYQLPVIIASIQIPFSIISTMLFIMIRFDGKNLLFSAGVIVKAILLVVFTVLFIVTFKRGIVGFFVSQLLAVSLSILLLTPFCFKYFKFKYSKKLIKKAFKYALPQFPARIGSILNSYGNRFFMVGFLTTVQIGIYSMALKIAAVMYLFHQTFTMAWNQFLFKIIKEKNSKEIIVKVLYILTPVICYFIVLLTSFSVEIISCIATNDYLDSANYIGVLCLCGGIMTLNEVFNVGPKITEKTKYLSYSFFLSLTVNLLGLLALTSKYGLLGVAISTLMANTTLLLSNWIITKKIFGLNVGVLYLALITIPTYIYCLFSLYSSQPLKTRLMCLVIFSIYFITIVTKFKSYLTFKRL